MRRCPSRSTLRMCAGSAARPAPPTRPVRSLFLLPPAHPFDPFAGVAPGVPHTAAGSQAPLQPSNGARTHDRLPALSRAPSLSVASRVRCAAPHGPALGCSPALRRSPPHCCGSWGVARVVGTAPSAACSAGARFSAESIRPCPSVAHRCRPALRHEPVPLVAACLAEEADSPSKPARLEAATSALARQLDSGALPDGAAKKASEWAISELHVRAPPPSLLFQNAASWSPAHTPNGKKTEGEPGAAHSDA